MSQMMPQDMAAMLGGGGGGGGGLPPDLAALLGGGAPPEAAEGEGPPLPSDGSAGGGGDTLEQAIALLDKAIAEEADHEDQQIMRQCSAKLHQILAKAQAEADKMMGGQASPGGMRKAAAAQGYGG